MNMKVTSVSLFVQKFAKLEITQNLYSDRRIQFGPSEIHDSSSYRKRSPFIMKEWENFGFERLSCNQRHLKVLRVAKGIARLELRFKYLNKQLKNISKFPNDWNTEISKYTPNDLKICCQTHQTNDNWVKYAHPWKNETSAFSPLCNVISTGFYR